MDVRTFIDNLEATGEARDYINAARTQFGIRLPTGDHPYPFAAVMPLVERENLFEEEAMYFLQTAAYDATRYSPIVPDQAMRSDGYTVKLGTQDKGIEIDGRNYDTLVRLARAGRVPALNSFMQTLLDTSVVVPLLDKIELHRTQAIVEGTVTLVGKNGFGYAVPFANPTGHRVTIASGTTGAPTGWYDDSYDPMEDIKAKRDQMGGCTHIFARSTLAGVLQGNAQIKAYSGRASISLAGGVTLRAGSATRQDIQDLMSSEGLPPITINNAQYRDEAGNLQYFLRDTAFVMLNTNEVDQEQYGQNPDGDIPLFDEGTGLGYVGNGYPAGRLNPGRHLKLEYVDNGKAPHVGAVATQTTGPVLRNSEAVQRLAVLNIPEPS